MKRSKKSVESNILPRLETRRLRLENRKVQQRRPSWFAEIDDYVHQLIRPIEKSAIFRFTGFCFAVFAVYQLTVDLSDRREERIERREARLEHALDRLLKPSDSDNGRGEALNTLIEADYPVGGLDLSCQKVGIWDAKLGCIGRPTFEDIHYSKADPSISEIEGVLKYRLTRNHSLTSIRLSGSSLEEGRTRLLPKFKSAIIKDSEFAGLDLKLYQFDDVEFFRIDLRGTRIPDLIFSRFQDSNAKNAEIAASALQHFRATNVSGTIINMESYFPPIHDRASEDFDSDASAFLPGGSALNWAWADAPPLFAPECWSLDGLSGICVKNPMLAELERIDHFDVWFRELNRIDPYFLVLCDPASREIVNFSDPQTGITDSTISHLRDVLSGEVSSQQQPPVIENPFSFRDYQGNATAKFRFYPEIAGNLDFRSVRILQKNTPIIPEKGVCDIVPVEEAMKRWPGVYGMSIQ